MGPAVPCDKGESAHLCSHLLLRGRTDIKSLLQALPAYSDCAHGCQGECAAIGSYRLSFSFVQPPEQTVTKTKLLSTKCAGPLVKEGPKNRICMLCCYRFSLFFSALIEGQVR